MKLVLEVLSGPPLAAKWIDLDQTRLLGRSPECDLVLPDPGVSRRHASIEARGDSLLLQDLGSRAGTLINDAAVEPNSATELCEHDRVRIGPWRFRVRREASKAATVAPVSLGSVTHIAAPVLAAERRLELIVEFAAHTVNAIDRAGVVEQLADFAQRGTGGRVASVLLENEGELQLSASMPATVTALAPLPELIDAAREGGVVQADVDLPGLNGVRPILAAALRVDKDVRGFLLVELMRPEPRQRADAAEFVHALVRLAGMTLGNVQRREVERRVERLHADLDQAREVQRRILPPASGTCAGTRYAFHVHPGRLVAGDMVDVFAIDARRCAVILGDIAGAGVGAGFLMASVQAYLHAELMETGDPAVAATRCNQYVSRVGGGRFATAWIGIVDALTRDVRFVDAGHGHGRIVDAAGTPRVMVARGAIPIGIDAHAHFASETLHLGRGERIVLFSDGVAEIRNAIGAVFAPDELDRTLRRSRQPESDIAEIIAGMEIFAGGQMPSDDASVLSFDVAMGH